MTTLQQPAGGMQRMTQADAKIALDRVIAGSGFSLGDLRRQAQTGEFETLRARLAWIAVRAIEG